MAKIKTRYGWIDMSEVVVISNLSVVELDFYKCYSFSIKNCYGHVIMKCDVTDFSFKERALERIKQIIKDEYDDIVCYFVKTLMDVKQYSSIAKHAEIIKETFSVLAIEDYNEFVQQWLDNKGV